jgi:hypothetical protein
MPAASWPPFFIAAGSVIEDWTLVSGKLGTQFGGSALGTLGASARDYPQRQE